MTKRKPKEEHKKVGRPTKCTPEVVAKLERAFASGLNDTEASAFAGISRDTYYDYVKANPEFIDRKQQLQNNPNIKAKLNIVSAINKGDLDHSRWWLERKNKKEFSTKIEIEEEINARVELYDIKKMTLEEQMEYIKNKLQK